MLVFDEFMEKYAFNYYGGSKNKSWNDGKTAVLADWELDATKLEDHNKILEKAKILIDGCHKMKGYLDTHRAQKLTSEETELRKR